MGLMRWDSVQNKVVQEKLASRETLIKALESRLRWFRYYRKMQGEYERRFLVSMGMPGRRQEAGQQQGGWIENERI